MVNFLFGLLLGAVLTFFFMIAVIVSMDEQRKRELKIRRGNSKPDGDGGE